jgi:hypothetical protein
VAVNNVGARRLLNFTGRIILFPLAGCLVTFAASLALGFLLGNGHLADRLTLGPTWILPTLFGFVSGMVVHSKAPHRANLYTWVAPCAQFAYHWFFGWVPEARWEHLLGSQCLDNECLDQLFVTMPAVFSLSFTFGAVVQSLKVFASLNRLDGRPTPPNQ